MAEIGNEGLCVYEEVVKTGRSSTASREGLRRFESFELMLSWKRACAPQDYKYAGPARIQKSCQVLSTGSGKQQTHKPPGSLLATTLTTATNIWIKGLQEGARVLEY